METTISSKFQVVIPSEARKRLHLKPKQKMLVLEKEGILILVPQRPMEELRGIAPRVPLKNFRDKRDRL